MKNLQMVLLLSLIAGGCDQTIVEEHWYEDTEEIECDWSLDTDVECRYGDPASTTTVSDCWDAGRRKFADQHDGSMCLPDPIECRHRMFRSFRVQICLEGCYHKCAGGLAICGEDMVDDMPGYFLSGTAECEVTQ